MIKKLLLFAMALALVVPLQSGQASRPQWETLEASNVWNYNSYRVRKLMLPPVVDGPFNLGDNVLVQTVASTCVNASCGQRDAYILRNGSAIHVPNVPKGVLSVENYLKNDNRVVWAAPLEDGYFDIVELDLLSGEKMTLAENIFMNDVKTMNVMVKDKEIFINPVFNSGQATVFRYNQAKHLPDLVTQRYVTYNEEILDIDLENGRILTKMTFTTGEKELWITKITSQYLRGEADHVLSSWTPKHEDIVGAHFRQDGAVEYFRMFGHTISTTDRGIDTFNTAALDDELNWTRPINETIFVEGDNMIWVNNDGELTVSNQHTGMLRPAVVDLNPVTVNEDQILYKASNGNGYVYDLVTGINIEVGNYRPVDRQGNAVVGIDPTGAIRYTNTSSNATLNLGYGMLPTMSDDRHVYWRGVDGAVHEATIASNPTRVGNRSLEAVKIDGNSTIFLIDGVNRWTIQSESVYFTWFNSWNDVKVVSPIYITRFRDAGLAAFAPGARIKSNSDARVYVIGQNNEIHWIANEAVAREVYGPSWNEHIVDIDTSELVSYKLGEMIDDVTTMNRI